MLGSRPIFIKRLNNTKKNEISLSFLCVCFIHKPVVWGHQNLSFCLLLCPFISVGYLFKPCNISVVLGTSLQHITLRFKPSLFTNKPTMMLCFSGQTWTENDVMASKRKPADDEDEDNDRKPL